MTERDYFIAKRLCEYLEGNFQYRDVKDGLEHFKILCNSHHGESFEGLEAEVQRHLESIGYQPADLPEQFSSKQILGDRGCTRAYQKDGHKIILGLHMEPLSGSVSGSICESQSPLA